LCSHEQPGVCEVKIGGTYDRGYSLYFVPRPKAMKGNSAIMQHPPGLKNMNFSPNPTYT